MNPKEGVKKTEIFSRGITLIALVITIIILLILAGISIAMLTGENGILTKTSTAKEESIIAEESEIIKLAYTENVTENITEGKEITSNNLQEKINQSKTAIVEEVSEIPEKARVIDNGLSSGTICKIVMEYDYYMYLKDDAMKKFYIELYNGEELVETLKFSFDENVSSISDWFNSGCSDKLENVTFMEMYPGGWQVMEYSFGYGGFTYNLSLTLMNDNGFTYEESLVEGKIFKAYRM